MRATDISVILSPLRSEIKETPVQVRFSEDFKTHDREEPASVIAVEVSDTSLAFVIGYEPRIRGPEPETKRHPIPGYPKDGGNFPKKPTP